VKLLLISATAVGRNPERNAFAVGYSFRMVLSTLAALAASSLSKVGAE
jgi:hypothetical protein